MSNEIPISRTEMIRRMVENWLDGADQEAIISYARGKLTEWYKDCNDEEVAELYSNEV